MHEEIKKSVDQASLKVLARNVKKELSDKASREEIEDLKPFEYRELTAVDAALLWAEGE